MFGLKERMNGNRIAHRQEIGGIGGGSGFCRVAGLGTGLISGTLVATAMGWRAAEALAPGDLILTFDRGLQPVRDVIRGASWDIGAPCPSSLWPLFVPAGALGNQRPMHLLPEQPVMIESDAADLLFGDPFALLTAADLDGVRGIERVRPAGALDVIQLRFDRDEVVFANQGALVFCPSVRVICLTEMLENAASSEYAVLSTSQAAKLVDCLCVEDAEVRGPSHAKGHEDQAAFA